MAAGIHGELKARTFREALSTFGLADPDLVRAMEAIEDQAHSITLAGAAKIESDALGSFVDLIG